MFSFLGDFVEGRNLVHPLSAVQMDCKYLKLFGGVFCFFFFLFLTLLKGQKHCYELSYLSWR